MGGCLLLHTWVSKDAELPECLQVVGLVHKERDVWLFLFNNLFFQFQKKYIFNLEKWKNKKNKKTIGSCNKQPQNNNGLTE